MTSFRYFKVRGIENARRLDTFQVSSTSQNADVEKTSLRRQTFPRLSRQFPTVLWTILTKVKLFIQAEELIHSLACMFSSDIHLRDRVPVSLGRGKKILSRNSN